MLGHTWDAKQVVRKPRVVATRVLSWDGLVGKILTGNQGFFPGNIGVWTEHVPSWNLKFCTLIARFSSFDSVSIVTNLHWISMINCQLCKSSGLNSKTQGHRVILIPHPGRTDIWEATGTPGYRSFGDDFETFSGSVLLQQMPLEGFLELGSLWSPWLVIVIVWINCLTPIDLPTLIHKTAPTLAGFLVHRVCSIHPETGPIIICVFVFVLTNPCHLPFPGSLDAGKIGCLFCWWGTKGTIKKETPMANGCLLNHGAGARVAQLELKGERLHFRLLEGQGPQTGWASLKLKAGSDRGIEGMEFLGFGRRVRGKMTRYDWKVEESHKTNPMKLINQVFLGFKFMDGPHGPMTYGYGFDLENLTAAGKAVAEAMFRRTSKGLWRWNGPV